MLGKLIADGSLSHPSVTKSPHRYLACILKRVKQLLLACEYRFFTLIEAPGTLISVLFVPPFNFYTIIWTYGTTERKTGLIERKIKTKKTCFYGKKIIPVGVDIAGVDTVLVQL